MTSAAGKREEEPDAPEAARRARVYGSATSQREAERIERMAAALSHQAPPWAAQYLARAAPAIGVIGAGCEAAVPVLVRAGGALHAAYLRLPSTVARGLGGLGVSFFGGRYAVSIAAWEAFRSMGGSQAYMCARDLAEQAQAVWTANAADEEEDEDRNGVADVKELDAGRLATRKMALVLRTVDPETVARAVGGLWTAYVGVLTVLKFQFAKTVALAESIAENLRPAMAKVVGPTLIAVTPQDYHKWISPAVSLVCKLIAGAVAWKVKQLASTVQSGFCGGLIASRALIELMRQHRLVSVRDDETLLDEVAGWSIGACGIYVQLFKGGPVPSLLSPLLWPLDVLEAILRWNVTWMDAVGAGGPRGAPARPGPA